MLMLALALAAELPEFDAGQVAKLCVSKLEDSNWQRIYVTTDKCTIAIQASYRRVHLIAANADDELAPVVERCVRNSTKAGVIDWRMASYCAVGNVDGRRDFGPLRRSGGSALRKQIGKCLEDSREDGVAEWSDAADCAREQISGHRDFLLFLDGAASREARAAIARCPAAAQDADDGIVDWAEAVDCAARGGLPAPEPEPSQPDEGEIVVT